MGAKFSARATWGGASISGSKDCLRSGWEDALLGIDTLMVSVDSEDLRESGESGTAVAMDCLLFSECSVFSWRVTRSLRAYFLWQY